MCVQQLRQKAIAEQGAKENDLSTILVTAGAVNGNVYGFPKTDREHRAHRVRLLRASPGSISTVSRYSSY